MFLSRWLMFWKINQHFYYFLKLNNSDENKKQIRNRYFKQDCFLFIALLFRLIHLICIGVGFCSHFSTNTEYFRLLQTDVTLFIGSPLSLNSVINSLWIQSLYFFFLLQICNRNSLGSKLPVVALVYNVLLNKNVTFFAYKWIYRGKRWQTVSQFIEGYISLYVRFLYQFASVTRKFTFFKRLKK